MPEAGGPFVLSARTGRGGHTGIEEADRLVEMARPQLDGAAVGQYPRPDFRVPGELVLRHPADQSLRIRDGCRRRHEVSGAAGSGEADHRGGKPARGLLIGGKGRKHAFADSQRGGGGTIPASGQFDRGGDEVRLRPRPGFTARHAPELAGQGRSCPAAR